MDVDNLMESSEFPLTPEPRFSVALPARSNVFVVPLHTPLSTMQQRRSEDNELISNDESLADLQPENSDEDDNDQSIVLTQEQQVGNTPTHFTLIDAHY